MEKGLKDRILKLRVEGKTYNEIKKLLSCTKSVISYYCKNAKLENYNFLKPPSKEEIDMFQKVYNETQSSVKVSEITGWSKPTILKYIIVKQKKTKEEKRKNNVEQVIDWRKKNKKKLIDYKGGCCEICKYDKCIEALEFHHKNPLEKDFGISGVTKSFDKMKKEVDKCILVCANCHREIHEELKLIK